jgi:hypothetical protein
MTRQQSLKQMALAATRDVQECIKQKLAESDSGKYSNDAVTLLFMSWIERVSNIPFEEIDGKMLTGEWIEIDGQKYLPSNLRIVKEYRNRAAAEPLVHDHDRARTTIPYDKLFQPSLFPKLDYEDVRSRSLVLGEANRVFIRSATDDHYLQYEKIQRANFEAQQAAYEKFVNEERQRQRLWKAHLDCKTTDDLMRRLGNWP